MLAMIQKTRPAITFPSFRFPEFYSAKNRCKLGETPYLIQKAKYSIRQLAFVYIHLTSLGESIFLQRGHQKLYLGLDRKSSTPGTMKRISQKKADPANRIDNSGSSRSPINRPRAIHIHPFIFLSNLRTLPLHVLQFIFALLCCFDIEAIFRTSLRHQAQELNRHGHRQSRQRSYLQQSCHQAPSSII